eukprot:7950275-Lingulodinium_polyedra.AAC.1
MAIHATHLENAAILVGLPQGIDTHVKDLEGADWAHHRDVPVVEAVAQPCHAVLVERDELALEPRGDLGIQL